MKRYGAILGVRSSEDLRRTCVVFLATAGIDPELGRALMARGLGFTHARSTVDGDEQGELGTTRSGSGISCLASDRPEKSRGRRWPPKSESRPSLSVVDLDCLLLRWIAGSAPPRRPHHLQHISCLLLLSGSHSFSFSSSRFSLLFPLVAHWLAGLGMNGELGKMVWGLGTSEREWWLLL